jgi:hypothetical protein
MGDEAGVTATVAVGDGATECVGDGFALVVVQALGGAEHNFDAQVVEWHWPRFCAWAAIMADRAEG